MGECRTCLVQLRENNCINVGELVNVEINVLEAIQEISSKKCSADDELPKNICKKCFKLLQSSLSFKNTIISSYNKLKSKLQKNNDCVVKHLTENSSKLELEHLTNVEEIKCSNKKEQNSNNLDTSKKCVLLDTLSNKGVNKELPKLESSTFKLCEKATSSQTCPTCGITIKGKKKFIRHLKVHNNHDNKLHHRCSICPKKYLKREYLLIHMRSHTGEKPYRCDICDKNFSQFATYYVHKRRLHDKVVQGTCSYCEKKFVDKAELDVHIRMWHTGERPYLCEFCSATFVCNRTLQRHRKEVHSEKKPCQKCGKMLGDYALKKHLLRHQVLEEGLKINRKKYTCEYCKTVMNFTSRRRHLEKQHGIKLYGRGDDCKKIPVKDVNVAGLKC